MKKVFLLFIILWPFIAQAQIITTVAGTGVSGHTGDGGPATSAKISFLNYAVFDKLGNLYFAELTLGYVRKITPSGIITTVAGNGNSGFGGDGSLATSASFNDPAAIAVDGFGNLYICDLDNNRIRKVDTNGIISTIAGNGTSGYGGDGGPSTSAIIYAPEGICCDKTGNIYFSDLFDHRVRKISTLGIITTVAGNGNSGYYGGDGGQADTSCVWGPIGVCFDKIGNLYIFEFGGARIRQVDTAGIIHTVAGNGTVGFGGDGGPATAAEIRGGYITIDNLGNLYIDQFNSGIALQGNRIRVVNSSGIINAVVGNGVGGYNGDGGLADTSEVNNPCGVAVDSCGNLYIADDYNFRVRKVAFNIECLPEGALNITTQHTLAIYPNPTYSDLNITYSDDVKSVIITNLLGQVVYAHEYNAKQMQINVAGLPGGIYFIKVNGSEVRRFVKE